MPYGDQKHEEIFEALVAILGERYVEDDPAIMQTFTRDFYQPVSAPMGELEFWVLPETTEDVQKIYKLANELDFPVSVSSTGFLLMASGAAPGYPYWCYIDPKRMNNFTIDAENMYAVVEPYVSIAQVQAEAMKVGLFCGVTGAGAQCSALATHIAFNTHYVGWRTGKGRNLLGVEGVLPNGEIFKTGSLAYHEDNYSWGEGPGISATALLRGAIGPMGSLGMVTRIGMKLYPWPGPNVLSTEGFHIDKKVRLPEEDFKSFFIHYPDSESLIDAVRKLGEAEIGGIVFQPSVHLFLATMTKSRKEFWEKWKTDFWQDIIHNRTIIVVSLWGFTSKKQMEYEEKVLHDIVEETKGAFFSEEVSQELCTEIVPNMIRNSHEGRMMRTGPWGLLVSSSDSLSDAVRSINRGFEVKEKFHPFTGDGGYNDMGNSQHFYPTDFGRIVAITMYTFGDKTAEFENEAARTLLQDGMNYTIENNIFNSSYAFEASGAGPQFANVHHHLANLKRNLDPNNIANPSKLIDVKKL